MRIRGHQDNSELQTVKPAVEQDAVKVHSRAKGAITNLVDEAPLDAAPNRITAQEDKVSLQISKVINAELNPEVLRAERRKRVEELKKLIEAGRYNPPGEAVARAVATEIATEIFLSGDKPASEE